METPVTILAVTAKNIKTDLEGRQYIENDTEVAFKSNSGVTLAFAFQRAQEKFPNALCFEIYQPRTVADEVARV